MSNVLPGYAELHCLSNFSFLRGASHAEELVARAAELGYAALAITDECSLAGIVRAHVAAKAVGLKLLVGSEFRLADGPKLVLIARNRDATRALLTRCIADKAIAPPEDMELSLDLIFGPLFYRLLMGHAPITRGFVDQLLAAVIPARD